MGYTSKYKGAEIDALLDKVERLPNENNSEKIYYFHIGQGAPINQDQINEIEAATQQGEPFGEVLTLAKDMLQENNEILELIKQKPIKVFVEMGYFMSKAAAALGQTYGSVIIYPAITEYISQGGVELIQIISLPIKDGLLEPIGAARHVYRKTIENGVSSEEFIVLTEEHCSYQVPSPGGTITDSAREANLKVLKYENYFDKHYVYTPSYQLQPVISKDFYGNGRELIYYDSGKLLKAQINKTTGDAVVTVLHDYNA